VPGHTPHVLVQVASAELGARDIIAKHGEIFAVFDSATQDSGNVAYGVEAGGERFFVKTAGASNDDRPFLAHAERVALLRNAVRLRRSVPDGPLPVLHQVVESADGPLLVYEWVEGEVLRKGGAPGAEASSAFARFRGLPAHEIGEALERVFRLHVELARQGWVASDFYDGCLIYDFACRDLHVIDLDNYREGPFFNDMGRMFGSTRFMAPEEHQLGVRIDERTTVFTLGRTIEQLFPAANARIQSVAARACELHPRRRFQTVEHFYEAWSIAAANAL
jgi:serine/threonine protein kinase, bacterial